MLILRTILALTFAIWTTTAVAQVADKRLALVVGNAGYEQITTLDNPLNDANLIGGVLEAAGFEVSYLFDATQIELNAAVVAFGRQLRDAGPQTVGLFYYAGHGVQSRGKNYLMPVDAAVTDAADLEIVAVEADVILRQMGSAKNATNIVILDACRNNPFAALEGLEKSGLAEMKASPGTFLSYSTGPGDVALDGLGRHSPFTAALAQEMRIPGIAIEQVFKKVRIGVVDETRGIQTPWDTSLLTTDFVFFQSDVVAELEAAETASWAKIDGVDAPIALIRFLRAYPQGRFATEARRQLQVALNDTTELSPAAPTRAVIASQEPDAAERTLFETARRSGVLSDYQAYIAAYPQGAYADLSRLEIELRE